MKIKLGIRGSSDSVNHILIKFGDMTLITAENLFLCGCENRANTAKNLVQLLDTLSNDHEISIKKDIAKMIEQELDMKGELDKYANE